MRPEEYRHSRDPGTDRSADTGRIGQFTSKRPGRLPLTAIL